MKIAFVVNSYPPRMGGLEQHLHSLAQGLSDLGHSVTVLTVADHAGSRRDGDVTVLTGRAHLPIADVISFPGLGTGRHLTRYLGERQFDVVSIHTRFFPMSFVGLRTARRLGIPVVHTEHGSGYVASSSPIIALGSRIVDLTMGRYVLRHASQVLGVSEEAVDFVRRLAGVDAHVFYNAITASRDVFDAAAGVRDRPGHLVFVGRMVPGKGWDTYLDALAGLRERGYRVDGEMLGDGADLDAARRRADLLGLGDLVRIPGRVSADQVRTSLAGSTLVNPTILSEGFQTTLLEAVAEHGRVVTFQVPGAALLRETGLPVKISAERTTESLIEGLIEILEKTPTTASWEMIEPWTWNNRARQYSDILVGAVNQGR